MRLRLSKLAIEDLTLIHEYTLGEWGEDQTVKYIDVLWDALEEVAAAPERWRLRPRHFRRLPREDFHQPPHHLPRVRGNGGNQLNPARRDESARPDAARFHGRRLIG